MKWQLGQTIGTLMCRAAGVDPALVTSIQLHNGIDEVAHLKIELSVTPDYFARLGELATSELASVDDKFRAAVKDFTGRTI